MITKQKQNKNVDAVLLVATLLWALHERPASEYRRWMLLFGQALLRTGAEDVTAIVQSTLGQARRARSPRSSVGRVPSNAEAMKAITRIARQLPRAHVEGRMTALLFDAYSSGSAPSPRRVGVLLDQFARSLDPIADQRRASDSLELNADIASRPVFASRAHVERLPEPPKRGDMIPVWFATDRLPHLKPKRPGQNFSNKRNDKAESPMTFGRADVVIPATHEEGTIERPTWWHLEFRPNEKKHMVVKKVQIQDLDHWVRDARHEGSEGLLFIHGFRVSFEEALLRTAQLTFDLKFTGVPLCFSWSSGGNLASYAYDTASITWAVDHLRDFLQAVTSRLGLSRLHIIAHSMGNRALLDSLAGWVRRAKTAPISQVVHAAPDVDTGVFRQRVEKFGKFKQVTLYASRTDRALLLSKGLHSGPRAGYAEPPLVMPKLSTIDVTSAGAELFGLGHSYYGSASKVFDDLYYLLRGFTPGKRKSVRPVTGQAYYELG